MADEQRRYTIEELQAEAAAMRAADTGVCDSFAAADVSMLPPGFQAHGPLCGCSNAAGWIETNQLCKHCGRHPEVHCPPMIDAWVLAAHRECSNLCPHDAPGERRCHCKCSACSSNGVDCRCGFCKLINPASS